MPSKILLPCFINVKDNKKRLVKSTKHKRPFKLIYFEECLNKQDAEKREGYLKSIRGRRWLGKRLSRFNKKR